MLSHCRLLKLVYVLKTRFFGILLPSLLVEWQAGLSATCAAASGFSYLSGRLSFERIHFCETGYLLAALSLLSDSAVSSQKVSFYFKASQTASIMLIKKRLVLKAWD